MGMVTLRTIADHYLMDPDKWTDTDALKTMHETIKGLKSGRFKHAIWEFKAFRFEFIPSDDIDDKMCTVGILVFLEGVYQFYEAKPLHERNIEITLCNFVEERIRRFKIKKER